jgi:glycosyltransferase involved in cell wall biosynthesis
MASGLAVACTDETGGSEIIRPGQTGHLLESNSIDSIENFLRLALDNKEWVRSLGAASAKQARKEVNWEGYARKLINLYQKTSAGSCQEQPMPVERLW